MEDNPEDNIVKLGYRIIAQVKRKMTQILGICLTFILATVPAMPFASVIPPYRIRRCITTARSLPDELNVDFSALYNIERFDKEENLKAGVKLTQQIRQLTVDYEAELKEIDESILFLQKKRKLVKLAHQCFENYTKTGRLSLIGKKDDDTRDALSDDSLKLADVCLAKYGLAVKLFKEDEWIGGGHGYGWKLSLQLARETPDEDDKANKKK